LVENLIAGVDRGVLATKLATQLPPARARREVAATADSPLLAVCRDLATRARRLELVAAIGRSHARGEPEATARPPTPRRSIATTGPRTAPSC
jgi:hypothetical protein